MPFNPFIASAKARADKANVELPWMGKTLHCAAFGAKASVDYNGVFASATAV